MCALPSHSTRNDQEIGRDDQPVDGSKKVHDSSMVILIYKVKKYIKGLQKSRLFCAQNTRIAMATAGPH
jgi:hypothetical protein